MMKLLNRIQNGYTTVDTNDGYYVLYTSSEALKRRHTI